MANKCNCNNEITCKCENCEYHGADNRCHAKNVHIGPKSAESCNETLCDTFKSR